MLGREGVLVRLFLGSVGKTVATERVADMYVEGREGRMRMCFGGAAVVAAVAAVVAVLVGVEWIEYVECCVWRSV